MKGLASFVMRGRWQAVLVIAVAALLALWVAPLLVFSGAALALVTLRRGAREGLLVLGMAALGSVLLALPLFGAPGPLLRVLLLFWLPVCLLAMTLRISVSLSRTLQAAAALGALAVLLFLAAVGDPGGWWQQLLEQLRSAMEQAGQNPAFLEVLQPWGPVIPGIVVSGFLFSVLLGVLLGRWWQALLFNPGGFGKEFRELRLGQTPALITVALFAVLLLSDFPPAANLVLILSLLYVLQGIAVAHGVVHKMRLPAGWLVGFYLLVLFLIQLVMLIGIVDTWVDFRARVRPRS